jgi:adenylyltransferase/sulfurtransferase
MLTESELERYNRQMLIPNWGKQGQVKLKKAKVVVAGVGGLGCPASLYLSATGIGTILLIDKETFELSNLNRQILGVQNDIGKRKVEAAQEKLVALNSDINILTNYVTITEDNVNELIHGFDIVVDAMDNWETRFLLNRACIQEQIAFIHAGVYGWSGQMTTIVPGKGPCLRCIIPRNPPEMKSFPVIGATPGFFATLQVMEVIKLLTEIGKPLTGRLLIFDGEDLNFSVVNVSRNPKCPVCKDITPV